VSEPGQVIALWAVPRSVSTAFEKTFSRRADTQVVHEPFTDCYYFSSARRSARYGDQPHKVGCDPAAAVAAIRAPSGAPLVFVKDLCFQAEPYLSEEFLGSVTNTFILRHPRVVLASLTPLKPTFSEDELGYLALDRLWHRVVDGLGQPPIVVDGEMFRARPADVLRAYCEAVGVDFEPGMLHWPDGRIREWSTDEQESQARWHRTLEGSTGILPPVPQPPVPVSAERRPAYERAEQIYRRISARALRPRLSARQ
jgi:hypothetical protein